MMLEPVGASRPKARGHPSAVTSTHAYRVVKDSFVGYIQRLQKLRLRGHIRGGRSDFEEVELGMI